MSADNGGGGSPAADAAAMDEVVRRELAKLSPAERESLRQQALDKLLRRRAVQVRRFGLCLVGMRGGWEGTLQRVGCSAWAAQPMHASTPPSPFTPKTTAGRRQDDVAARAAAPRGEAAAALRQRRL